MSRPFILGNSTWITTTAFLQLFEDIEVRNYNTRYDSQDYNKKLKVDISLDTKERVQYKLLAGGHYELEQKDTRLPRIGIQIAAMVPDVERYSGKNAKRTFSSNVSEKIADFPLKSSVTYDLQPFPIKITYTASIWAKYFEHYAQILENIIPWFDPYVIVGVKERNFGIERELKVSLVDIGQSLSFEMEGGAARLVRGDLTFDVETYAYKTMNEDLDTLILKTDIHISDIISPISSETISISAEQSDMLL